jgi:hypothetical protein
MHIKGFELILVESGPDKWTNTCKLGKEIVIWEDHVVRVSLCNITASHARMAMEVGLL